MNKSDLDKLDSILSASEPLTIPTYYLKKPYSLTNISIPLLSLFNLGEENFNILRNILNKRVLRIHNAHNCFNNYTFGDLLSNG